MRQSYLTREVGQPFENRDPGMPEAKFNLATPAGCLHAFPGQIEVA